MKFNLIILMSLLIGVIFASCESDDSYYPGYSFDNSAAIIFLSEWGYPGESNGNFKEPFGIVSDLDDNIYVSDSGNNRIQKFDKSGVFQTTWGTYGKENCQFNNPKGIAVDSSNNIYVADKGNNRIQKFNSAGNFLTSWGSYGSGDGQFNNPYSLTTDSSGFVYVTDFNNNRIQVFDSSGTYIRQFGTSGKNDGELYGPRGIAVDSKGFIYVGDCTEKVQKFDSSGIFITKITLKNNNIIFSVFIDNSDNLHISTFYYIRIYDKNLNFLYGWGSFGTLGYDSSDSDYWDTIKDNKAYCDELRNENGDMHGYFSCPGQIAVLSDGSIFIADSSNCRIQSFQIVKNYWDKSEIK